MKLKTLEDVNAAVDKLRSLGDQASFGKCIDCLKNSGFAGRDIIGAYLVHMGKALPETVLLDCPAADNLRHLSLDDQRRHVLEREPFSVLEDLDTPPAKKVYDELTAENCECLFAKPPIGREIAAGIDGGDAMTFTFRDGNFVRFTRINKDVTTENPEQQDSYAKAAELMMKIAVDMSGMQDHLRKQLKEGCDKAQLQEMIDAGLGGVVRMDLDKFLAARSTKEIFDLICASHGV